MGKRFTPEQQKDYISRLRRHEQIDIFQVGNGFFDTVSSMSQMFEEGLHQIEEDYEKIYRQLIDAVEESKKYFNKENQASIETSILDDLIEITHNNFTEEDLAVVLDRINAFNVESNNDNIIGLTKILENYGEVYADLFEALNYAVDFMETTVGIARGEKIFHQIGVLGNEGTFYQYIFDEKTYSSVRRDRKLMQIQVQENKKDGKLFIGLGTRSGLNQNDVLTTLQEHMGTRQPITISEENNPLLYYFRDENQFKYGSQNLGLGRFNEDFMKRVLTQSGYSKQQIDELTKIDVDFLTWWKGGDQNFTLNNGTNQYAINFSQKSLDFYNRATTGYGYTQATYSTISRGLKVMSNQQVFQQRLIKSWQDTESIVLTEETEDKLMYGDDEENTLYNSLSGQIQDDIMQQDEFGLYSFVQ